MWAETNTHIKVTEIALMYWNPIGSNNEYKRNIRVLCSTAISRPGGYEVYRLASNMPKSQKIHKLLPANVFVTSSISNQKEMMKRGMTWAKQKPKGTTCKGQFIATANPIYIDLMHQWQVAGALPPISKIHPFSKIVIHFGSIMQFCMLSEI